MRITRLRLRHFKAHHDLAIVPAPGLTIIRGPNESGKSTIRQALELALFRKADTNREDVRLAWSWGSDEPPEVELEFEADGQAGVLRKRFAGSRSEAELTLEGQTLTDYQAIQDALVERLGVPTDGFYRATASVGHSELDAVSGAPDPAIGDRLQLAISGADRGTAQAKKKLETAIRRYRAEGHKNPGVLKVARAEIARLEGAVAAGERALAELERDRAAWVEADARREELDRTLAERQAQLDEAERAVDLAGRRDMATERYERLRRAAELTTAAATLAGVAPGPLALPELRAAVVEAQTLELELSELQADADAALVADAGLQPELAPPRPMAWLAAAAVLVVAGWVAMFLLHGAGLLGVLVFASIAVGIVVTLGQTARLARRRRQYGLAMQLAATERARQHELAREQSDLIRRQERRLQELLRSADVADVAAAQELLAATERRNEELATIEAELRGLRVEERDPVRLAAARDEAAGEAEMARHALTAMGALADDPAGARRAAQRAVDLTRPERDDARSAADEARGRAGANQADAEVIAGLAEQLATERERLAEAEHRVAVYEGTLAAIEAAELATLKTAARFLEEQMGPTVATMTGGRYDAVAVDEQQLSFRVRAPESGELVDAAQLSQGTADQLYLAARLGLVRLVTLDRRPPLILDDPFVTFDQARGERALRVVRELAHERGFQVLFLTCSEHFDALADSLVVLSAPMAQPKADVAQTNKAARSADAADRTNDADASLSVDVRPTPGVPLTTSSPGLPD